MRRRISIAADGSAVVDGVYPIADDREVTGLLPMGMAAYSWALDESGALYEAFGDKVVRSAIDGTQTQAYETPPASSEKISVYGGLSAHLVTGP